VKGRGCCYHSLAALIALSFVRETNTSPLLG